MTKSEAIKVLNMVEAHGSLVIKAKEMAIKALEQQPKIGEWCKQNDDYFDWYECSECGYGSEGEMQYSSEHDVRTNYCPNCGAKMGK